jgi:hypothetical protein
MRGLFSATMQSMAMGWGARRRSLYITVFCVFAAMGAVAIYLVYFTAPPMCMDGIQNGSETGVDCGGTCSLICANTAHAPVVMWARSFEVAPGNYTAAAYIQNTNAGAGSKQVAYTFQLFDASNALITERDGVADLPPVQTIPIVEPNIEVGHRTATRTLFVFKTIPVWHTTAAGTIPNITIGQESLAGDGTTLSAQLTNNGLTAVSGLHVVAVLFNSAGTAIAASKTVVPSMPQKSDQPITFTWPTPNAAVAHAEITVLPSF